MALTQTHQGSVVHGASTMNVVDWIAMVLLIVGGINWGLVGLFDFNLVAAIFGDMSVLSRLVYILVGASAVWCLYTATKLGRSSTTRAP
jgi:uncharacterized protein